MLIAEVVPCARDVTPVLVTCPGIVAFHQAVEDGLHVAERAGSKQVEHRPASADPLTLHHRTSIPRGLGTTRCGRHAIWPVTAAEGLVSHL